MRCCFEQNQQQQNDVQLFIEFVNSDRFRGREPGCVSKPHIEFMRNIIHIDDEPNRSAIKEKKMVIINSNGNENKFCSSRSDLFR